MDRLKGLGSLLVVISVVLLALRTLHLALPVVFPSTRPGPVTVTTVGDARRLVGFAPMAPAYRPALLGERPTRMEVTLGPRPSFAISWRAGDAFLDVTQVLGGSAPDHPPLAQPMLDAPDSFWWTEGAVEHLVVQRDGFWFEFTTSLPASELRRFVDTLAAQ